MKFLENLPNQKNRLWGGLLIFGLGILFTVYFGVWIATGILAVIFIQLSLGVYFIYRYQKNLKPVEPPQVIEAFVGDTLVKEVMVPRTDMVTVAESFTVEDSLDLILFNGFSRMPVYGEGIDDIKGIAHAKDLMSALS